MRTIVVVCVFMVSISVYCQNQKQDYRGRIGINTTEPKATLDISKRDDLPEDQIQGVSFPNLSTEERNKFTGVRDGIMIYNSDKECIEVYTSGGNWRCMMSWGFDLGGAVLENVDISIVSFRHLSVTHQGRIDSGSNKIKVKIPYRGGEGSYESISIESTSVAGENNQTKKLVLKIPAGNFDASGIGLLEGEIEVLDGGEYLVKQLGIGEERVIAEFVIQTKSGDGIVSLKGIGGIVDRCFNKSTRQCWGYGLDELEHQFMYMPIEGPDGKIWLSQNLGAEYSRVDSPDFAPGKGDFSEDDKNAYGSLFQWQRPSDGHELINWSSSTGGTAKYGSSSTLSNHSNWRANNNLFIRNSSTPPSWVSTGVNNSPYNKNLWQREGLNNPCPVGYHVPTKEELEALHRALISSGRQIFNHSGFRLPAAGLRHESSATLSGMSMGGGYWSSEQSSTHSSWCFNFSSNTSVMNHHYRASARSVRCLKD